jgi:hypothetical protein
VLPLSTGSAHQQICLDSYKQTAMTHWQACLCTHVQVAHPPALLLQDGSIAGCSKLLITWIVAT